MVLEVAQMDELTNRRCCFVGHRKIEQTAELEARLYSEIEKLIVAGVDTFYFGSKSEFDRFCYVVVSILKEKYPHIKRIYVRAEYSDINEDYTDYLLESYEDTYYPNKIRNSGKAAYVERNQHMINLCGHCIVYYIEGYLPPRRRNSRRDLTDYQPKSGTKIAYDYAVQKKKNVINVAP